MLSYFFAFLNFAHLFFCASTMRALASGLILRRFFFAFGLVATLGAAVLPFTLAHLAF